MLTSHHADTEQSPTDAELILDSDALLSFKPEEPASRIPDPSEPDDDSVAVSRPNNPPANTSEGSVVDAEAAFAENSANLEHQIRRLDIVKQALDETALKVTGAHAALELIEQRTAEAKVALNDCVTQLEARVAAIGRLVDLAVHTDHALSNVEARLIALTGSRTSLGRVPLSITKRTMFGVLGAAGFILLLATMLRHGAASTASASGRSGVGSTASVAEADRRTLPAEQDALKPSPAPAPQDDASALTASSKPQAVRRSPAGPLFIGSVMIDSVPESAAVFVNQQRVGRTPLRVEAVRAGSNVIRIERDGYKPWSRAVRVVTDQQTTVRAVLEANPAP